MAQDLKELRKVNKELHKNSNNKTTGAEGEEKVESFDNIEPAAKPSDWATTAQANEGQPLDATQFSEVQPSPFKGLTIGRIVHVVLPDNCNNPGESRAAIVTDVIDKEKGIIDADVFCNSRDIQPVFLPKRTQYFYDEMGELHPSWHWIPRED